MKKHFLKYSLGIDVSKDNFHCCISVIGSEQSVKVIASKRFSNRKAYGAVLKAWIRKHCKLDLPLVITMEATGVYYEHLAWFLHEQGFHVSVIVPNKAKKYMQSVGLKTKNDKIDARGLAQMGAEQCLKQWQPISKYFQELRALTRQHEDLQKTKSTVTNQIHANKYSRQVNKSVLRQQKQHVKFLDKQLSQNEEQIEKCVAKDPVVKQKIDKICKIKGMALLSVATVIAETNGFELFENIRQLVSYAGYDVIENQSGKHQGKTKISKKGNSHIRRILHMPAFNVVRYEQQPFLNLFHRVFDRTKIKMKGYVAVQKKLLTIIYTLWKNDTTYDSVYLSRISGNQETKPLFQLTIEKSQKKAGPTLLVEAVTQLLESTDYRAVKKIGGQIKHPPTQDKLPSKQSTEAFFQLT